MIFRLIPYITPKATVFFTFPAVTSSRQELNRILHKTLTVRGCQKKILFGSLRLLEVRSQKETLLGNLFNLQ